MGGAGARPRQSWSARRPNPNPNPNPDPNPNPTPGRREPGRTPHPNSPGRQGAVCAAAPPARRTPSRPAGHRGAAAANPNPNPNASFPNANPNLTLTLTLTLTLSRRPRRRRRRPRRRRRLALGAAPTTAERHPTPEQPARTVATATALRPAPPRLAAHHVGGPPALRQRQRAPPRPPLRPARSCCHGHACRPPAPAATPRPCGHARACGHARPCGRRRWCGTRRQWGVLSAGSRPQPRAPPPPRDNTPEAAAIAGGCRAAGRQHTGGQRNALPPRPAPRAPLHRAAPRAARPSRVAGRWPQP